MQANVPGVIARKLEYGRAKTVPKLRVASGVSDHSIGADLRRQGELNNDRSRHLVPGDSDASYGVTDDLQDKPTDSRTSQTVNSARIHRADISMRPDSIGG